MSAPAEQEPNDPAPEIHLRITTPKPRIGGVTDDGGSGEAWVGGSNVHQLPSTFTCIGQRRPTKHSSAKMIETANNTGTPFKSGRTNDESQIPFSHWISLLDKTIRERGLDTPMLVPDLDT